MLLSVYGILFSIVIPLLAGFYLEVGFNVDVILQKFSFYNSIGLGAIFGLVVLVIFNAIKFGPGDASVNGILIHNPEKGIFNFAWVRNPITLIIVIGLFFSLIGILIVGTQQEAFAGIPVFEQQFTETGDLFFAIWPASTSETLTMIFVDMFALTLLALLWKRLSLPKNFFFPASVVLVTVVSSVFGLTLHSLRYGASDISLAGVGVWWGVAGLLYVLFGSVIVPLVMHDLNNLFQKLSDLFSSEAVVGVSFAIWFGVLLLVVAFFAFRSVGKNKGRGGS